MAEQKFTFDHTLAVFLMLVGGTLLAVLSFVAERYCRLQRRRGAAARRLGSGGSSDSNDY